VRLAASIRDRTNATGYLVVVAIAGVLFWIAYDDGSYALSSRSSIAIAAWWGILVGVALGLFPSLRVPRGTDVVGGLLVGLALLTLVSVLWAPSAEGAINSFNRVSLYLAIYMLVVLASTRRTLTWWADALALAVVAIATVALLSRLFPDVFPDRGLVTFLPSVATRLSFPLGYWNGLGIFIGLGSPLLLRRALTAERPIMRAFALAPVPVLVSALYLTSSRGGFATALVSAAVFLALTERRWAAMWAIAVCGLGATVALAVMLTRDELVNGPLDSDVAREQGRSAALLIVLACGGLAILYGLGLRWLGGRVRPSPKVGRLVVGAALLVALGAIVMLDPVDRIQEFKSLNIPAAHDDFVRAHLLSGSGGGRWQFWSAAVDQWESHPVVGDGAGTYESWWAEHASFSYFVRYTHSLYLQALGELGLLGLALTAGLALAGVFVGAHRTLRARGEERVTMAALTSVFAGFAFAAAFDWVWELTAVTVFAVIALALTTGPATSTLAPPRIARQDEPPVWSVRRRLLLGTVTVVAAWILIAAQAIPLVSDREVARSRSAVLARDLGEAREAADAARAIQPWAATPYLQLALVREEAGDLDRAREWIEEAMERDPRNWRLWLVGARLETKLGRVGAAERSLRRAIALNPRSPLFEDLIGDGS
jgi:tetratricopeptide (TPR) repeat protein